jgi:hypothetical protein
MHLGRLGRVTASSSRPSSLELAGTLARTSVRDMSSSVLVGAERDERERAAAAAAAMAGQGV